MAQNSIAMSTAKRNELVADKNEMAFWSNQSVCDTDLGKRWWALEMKQRFDATSAATAAPATRAPAATDAAPSTSPPSEPAPMHASRPGAAGSAAPTVPAPVAAWAVPSKQAGDAARPEPVRRSPSEIEVAAALSARHAALAQQ